MVALKGDTIIRGTRGGTQRLLLVAKPSAKTNGNRMNLISRETKAGAVRTAEIKSPLHRVLSVCVRGDGGGGVGLNRSRRRAAARPSRHARLGPSVSPFPGGVIHLSGSESRSLSSLKNGEGNGNSFVQFCYTVWWGGGGAHPQTTESKQRRLEQRAPTPPLLCCTSSNVVNVFCCLFVSSFSEVVVTRTHLCGGSAAGEEAAKLQRVICWKFPLFNCMASHTDFFKKNWIVSWREGGRWREETQKKVGQEKTGKTQRECLFVFFANRTETQRGATAPFSSNRNPHGFCLFRCDALTDFYAQNPELIDKSNPTLSEEGWGSVNKKSTFFFWGC
eukprot:TRINITY_DN1860_c1_g1_i1.p1 TRINITY_DN1860_c1_g1~~TRINITY_DN1860_c1_g1_i1.p1  ORF type:complete len:333 (-),score=-53.40 TRINITY_DN1860_c1_g1_i1:58-1056(-)